MRILPGLIALCCELESTAPSALHLATNVMTDRQTHPQRKRERERGREREKASDQVKKTLDVIADEDNRMVGRWVRIMMHWYCNNCIHHIPSIRAPRGHNTILIRQTDANPYSHYNIFTNGLSKTLLQHGQLINSSHCWGFFSVNVSRMFFWVLTMLSDYWYGSLISKGLS